MSATFEEGRVEPSPSSDDSPASGGRGGEAQQASSTGDGKAPEKTISCVSCRKRKLKCDRIKPKCGTCTRLRHECEYPERRRTLGSKRRNMKELEARLAQVETQLVAESKMSAAANTTSGSNIEPDWNTLGMNYGYADDPLFTPGMEMPQSGYNFQGPGPSTATGDFFSQELLSLGLQEPLPPQDMMDELHQIYFDIYHPQLPMMHKLRYYASLDRAPHMRPPICLRYAMWTMAASLSDKYKAYEDILYERARKYIEAAEMKGRGEQFVSVYHAQTWSLIGTFEAKKAYFSRAWVSVGRMTRITQMLGLYRLDGDVPGARKIIPPARDWIEHEERRRTFWAAYNGDRWASSGTGWPMIIDERDIQTNLPASEEAFERGVMEPTITLEEGLTVEGAPKLSSFAGVILSSALFGHNHAHLHRKGPNENPGDLANGEFWKRHRKMENVLSNIFMFLPQQLRLPGGIRDMNVIFLHMNIHASTICLQQAAVNTGERYNIDSGFIRQLHARSLVAAEEIANVMRLASYVDATKMNSWSGFCLYVAGGIFIKDQNMPNPQPQSASNLEFVLAAMRAIGKKHSVTDHFTAQLELDIEVANLGGKISPYTYCVDIPNTPMNGILANRNGLPMTTENLQSFLSTNSFPPENCPIAAKVFMDSTVNLGPVPSNDASNWPVAAVAAKAFMLNEDGDSSSRTERTPMLSSMPGFKPGQLPVESTSVTGSVPTYQSTINSTGQTTDANREKEISDDTTLEIAVEAGAWAGNTPSTDSSSSNTRQYPYRQTDPSNYGKSMDYGIFQSDMMRSSTSPPDWIMQEEFTGMSNMDSLHPNDGFDEFLANGPWAQGTRQD